MELPQKEWLAMGEKLFGPQARAWRFKCPRCGNVATPQQFLERSPELTPEGAVSKAYQECIKRDAALKRHHEKLGPDECDWVSFGLFSGPWIVVAQEDGKRVPVFAFDGVEEPKPPQDPRRRRDKTWKLCPVCDKSYTERQKRLTIWLTAWAYRHFDQGKVTWCKDVDGAIAEKAKEALANSKESMDKE